MQWQMLAARVLLELPQKILMSLPCDIIAVSSVNIFILIWKVHLVSVSPNENRKNRSYLKIISERQRKWITKINSIQDSF
jgi:hypothetical protein